MNLTDEQYDLLRKVVAVYNAGDTSQFIVNRTLNSGSSLIYSGGHPPVAISADDSDFKQLEQERLVVLNRNSGGGLCGKPTRLGIEAAKAGSSTSVPVRATEVTAGTRGVQMLTDTLGTLLGGSVKPERNRRDETDNPDPRRVAVVHGRNEAARLAMFEFLRSINLDPKEWSEVLAETGKGTPLIVEALDALFRSVQAVVVLITGDDLARLGTRYLSPHDPPDEGDLTPQARPNVLFEAGLAFGRHPDKTVMVTLGRTRSFSDVAGRHVVRIDDTVDRRRDLASRLQTVGCAVDIVNRSDWQRSGNFSAASVSPDLESSAKR